MSGNGKIWINGSAVNTTTNGTTGTMSAGDADLVIGRRQSYNDRQYYGLIDEVRFWSDERTNDEIADNYQNQIDPASAGLIAYYRFNNGGTDETSNDNDLTASGATYSTTVPFEGTYPSEETPLTSPLPCFFRQSA